jgi:hypothetical protein
VQSDGRCNACFWGTHPGLTPTGTEAIKAGAFAPGYDRTTFQFHQCETCGSVWMIYTEIGPGRQDAMHVRITKGFLTTPKRSRAAPRRARSAADPIGPSLVLPMASLARA